MFKNIYIYIHTRTVTSLFILKVSMVISYFSLMNKKEKEKEFQLECIHIYKTLGSSI